jgi:NADH:ubiquinone oxidoreductase subunit 4 (subunit M)
VGFGVDGLALVFILLTSFIFVLIFLSAWKYNLNYVNEYCFAFFGIEFFLIFAFISLKFF